MDIHSTSPAPSLRPVLPTTREKGLVEEVFIKAARLQEMSMGMVYYLSRVFDTSAEDGQMSEFLAWAKDVAKETLNMGMDVVPNL